MFMDAQLRMRRPKHSLQERSRHDGVTTLATNPQAGNDFKLYHSLIYLLISS